MSASQDAPADQIPEEVEKSLDSGRVWDRASIATMSVGGAALLTGVTLLILNSPRPVAPKDSSVASRTQFEPLVGPTDARLRVKLSF